MNSDGREIKMMTIEIEKVFNLDLLLKCIVYAYLNQLQDIYFLISKYLSAFANMELNILCTECETSFAPLGNF